MEINVTKVGNVCDPETTHHLGGNFHSYLLSEEKSERPVGINRKELTQFQLWFIVTFNEPVQNVNDYTVTIDKDCPFTSEGVCPICGVKAVLRPFKFEKNRYN